MPTDEDVLKAYETSKGAIEIIPKVKVDSREDLALRYTPGVAVISNAIKNDKSKVYTYTGKPNNVAIITDGSRILGLGNIGPEAGLPVMEAKAMLFKKYGGVDAVPICLDTQEEESIISIVKALAPVATMKAPASFASL